MIVHLKGQLQPIITVGKWLPNVLRTFYFLKGTSNPGFYMNFLYFQILATNFFNVSKQTNQPTNHICRLEAHQSVTSAQRPLN